MIIKPIPNITTPASSENVKRQLENQGDYTESVETGIATATTNNEVVQARLGHDNLTQTLSAYYNHLPTVTYEGLTVGATTVTFNKIVWYYKGRQVVKKNKTITVTDGGNEILNTKLANTTGLGSTTVLGNVINTSATAYPLLDVINTYLVNPITNAELTTILAGLGTTYKFEIGVGDRRAGVESRFTIATNWSGDEVTDLLLTPDAFPTSLYNHRLTFSKTAKTLKVTDTHAGQASNLGAIRYFKVIPIPTAANTTIYFNLTQEDFTTIYGANTVPVYYFTNQLEPAIALFNYDLNPVPYDTTINNFTGFAWRVDRTLPATGVLVKPITNMQFSNIDFMGLDIRFRSNNISTSSLVFKNIRGLVGYDATLGYVDFTLASGDNNCFHMLDRNKIVFPNNNTNFTTIEIPQDRGDGYYLTLKSINPKMVLKYNCRRIFKEAEVNVPTALNQWTNYPEESYLKLFKVSVEGGNNPVGTWCVDAYAKWQIVFSYTFGGGGPEHYLVFNTRFIGGVKQFVFGDTRIPIAINQNNFTVKAVYQ